jgi:hypothetical protein
MKYIFLALIFLLLQLGCQNQPISHNNSENVNSFPQAQAVEGNSDSNVSNQPHKSDTENAEETYPGITIDQKFPIIEFHDFMEGDFKEKTYSVNVEGFQVTAKKFSPQTIGKNGKTIFDFRTLHSIGYWSSLVGVSHLLGENSKQIYVIANGPGGVCCTNYWITDVSNGTPRNIFRSEDFGGFRNPMEIFDADNDGIYELVQFDSSFRYFMDDCGSCSPEPRAVFKYNKKAGTYLPAKNVQQDFVKESLAETEKWLAETFEKLKTKEDVGEKLNFHRSLLAHVVDLLYLGDDRKAWETFDMYSSKDSYTEKTRAEIKKRLRQSKFYQVLKKLG